MKGASDTISKLKDGKNIYSTLEALHGTLRREKIFLYGASILVQEAILHFL